VDLFLGSWDQHNSYQDTSKICIFTSDQNVKEAKTDEFRMAGKT